MSCEIIVRKQDGCEYREFGFPLEVLDKKTAIQRYGEDDSPTEIYGLFMGFECVGSFKEKRHAIHIMNYILTQRIHYVYEQDEKKVLILTVPTNDIVMQTPEENLLYDIPTEKGE